MISLMTWWTTWVKQRQQIHHFGSTTTSKPSPHPQTNSSFPPQRGKRCRKLTHLSQVLAKTLTLGTASFSTPPLCEFTTFQRAHNGLLGQHYSSVGGRRHFRACSVSSLHVPLLAVNNRVGLLYSTITLTCQWKATWVHCKISCGYMGVL